MGKNNNDFIQLLLLSVNLYQIFNYTRELNGNKIKIYVSRKILRFCWFSCFLEVESLYGNDALYLRYFIILFSWLSVLMRFSLWKISLQIFLKLLVRWNNFIEFLYFVRNLFYKFTNFILSILSTLYIFFRFCKKHWTHVEL